MFGLLAICGVMTVIILMQKPSANAGMGAALGGGAAESVFGGETANVLLKYTVRISVAFFVLSFVLYIVGIAHHRPAPVSSTALPTFGSPAATTNPAPAKTATSGTATAPAADTSLKLPQVAPAANQAPASSAAPAASTPAYSAPATSAPASSAPAAKN